MFGRASRITVLAASLAMSLGAVGCANGETPNASAIMKPYQLISIAIGLIILASSAFAQVTPDRVLKPDAAIDLRTTDGVNIVNGQWKYSDAKIIDVDHHSVGADLKASGPPNRTQDITPKAGAADFDDSTWESIDESSLEQRRSTGKLCFNWYRINVTIPQRIGSLDPTRTKVYFEIVADDYAEVWIDGQLPPALGTAGGQITKGWNAPNRVMFTENAKPGQRIQLAIFAANGPLSSPPGNFIWIRSATLDFYKPGRVKNPNVSDLAFDRLDAALDAIIPCDAKIEKLAGGFGFTEGPTWFHDSISQRSFLLFFDPNNNTIYRYDAGDVSVYRIHSGYSGIDIGEYGQPGSNGLAQDPQGRLTICEHGNRRITRLEKNGVLTMLADRFEGKRLNSPNDLVYRSDGTLYFTDPPFGLPKFFDDSRKELAFSGVYAWKDGTLRLVSKDLSGPNGLAFSPDEKFLYVDNWDEKHKVVMRYDVASDGSLSNGKVFFDVTKMPGEQAWDGLKVDRTGNLYIAGPGGIWIVSSDGKHLGTIKPPKGAGNFNWGDANDKTLYITAHTGLYRLRLDATGAAFRPAMETAMQK
ncbi:MAG TPA: SMP-30/gluconolactonase/LRE family protein [Tepidisphaeraceae bacterium]|nr:SMP-30/gluconolactonase/LRE family protein [Tepidisphaeraceae bacterium]